MSRCLCLSSSQATSCYCLRCFFIFCVLRFSACQDLVLSRFCCKHYELFDVVGIQIHRIMRVMNRSLRIRFDDALRSYMDDDETYLPSAKFVISWDCILHVFHFLLYMNIYCSFVCYNGNILHACLKKILSMCLSPSSVLEVILHACILKSL